MDKNKNLPTIRIERELLIYNTPDGSVKVEVLLQDENLWLSQDRMAELFGTQRAAITKHLLNIYDEGELKKEVTSSKMEQVRKEGSREVTRNIEFYSLDAIIAVGYRVNSHRATMFRIWATERLKEYIIKGFTMDDERLKTPNYTFGKDYFEEQLERIQTIRTSERRVYQKITDLYIQCSADYKLDSEITKNFFAAVQNKLHFAITHQTAAEIIYSRADSEKEHMGLTTWKNAPAGLIRKPDVSVAKNYLNENEMSELNRIVEMYLLYAEDQAKRHQVVYMEDWVKKLNVFLNFNERDILENTGKVSAEVAKQFAESEFEKFNLKQIAEYKSDFDNLLDQVDKSNRKNKEK